MRVTISVKTKLMEKYKSVPDRVIALAMDSVDYDEEKAVHILDIMIAEEAVQPLRTSSSHRYFVIYHMIDNILTQNRSILLVKNDSCCNIFYISLIEILCKSSHQCFSCLHIYITVNFATDTDEKLLIATLVQDFFMFYLKNCAT